MRVRDIEINYRTTQLKLLDDSDRSNASGAGASSATNGRESYRWNAAARYLQSSFIGYGSGTTKTEAMTAAKNDLIRKMQ